MEEDRRRRHIIILFIIGLVVLVVLIVYLQTRPKPTLTQKEGTVGTVYVDDHGKLQELLFDQQFYQVEGALSDYIGLRVSPSTESAELVGDPAVPESGIIEFKVRTGHPYSEFKVRLDRKTDFDKIYLNVVGTDYKKTLDIYSDPTPSEVNPD